MTFVPTPDQSKALPDTLKGILAPFAKKNYYRQFVTTLKSIVKELCEQSNTRKQDYQIFCNSRLPEKKLALLAGMGTIGRNSLLYTKNHGSQIVIGGILLPFIPSGLPGQTQAIEDFDMCRNCRRCVDACPTKAIPNTSDISPAALLRRNGQNPIVSVESCIQHLSTQLLPLKTEIYEKWNYRIYGCNVCQDVCPYNKAQRIYGATENENSDEFDFAKGYVDIIELLEKDESELKEYFKNTILGSSWMPPLVFVRNAIIAAGNYFKERTPYSSELIKAMEKWKTHRNEAIRHALRWALSKKNINGT